MSNRPNRNLITILLCDRSGTVLGTQTQKFTYTPFGYDRVENTGPSHLGFNGERRSRTDSYILGSFRSYLSVLMRFNSPDNLSPFDAGGVNPYTYVDNNPINMTDPTGHLPWIIRKIFSSNASLQQHSKTRADHYKVAYDNAVKDMKPAEFYDMKKQASINNARSIAVNAKDHLDKHNNRLSRLGHSKVIYQKASLAPPEQSTISRSANTEAPQPRKVPKHEQFGLSEAEYAAQIGKPKTFTRIFNTPQMTEALRSLQQ
ncbi:RHS repeat-associated core domain-containing protein [Pseudomonas sp. TE50-2]|uniref:RHS repeat-associated core domain-containing protein n=1 Tax=Pseudomonas sp. TE50-2 TaxID=3142707 RepID=UPI0034666699